MLTFKIETEGKEHYFRAKDEASAIQECDRKFKYYTLYLRLYTGALDNIPMDRLVIKKKKSWWISLTQWIRGDI